MKDFSDKLGYSRQNIYSIFNGRTALTVEMLISISKALDVDVSYFFDSAPMANTSLMPSIVPVVVDKDGNGCIVMLDIKAAAGLPYYINDPEYYRNLPTFSLPEFRYQKGDYYAIQVTGDSMHPTICNQDWLICKRIYNYTDIREGYVHIVVNSDGVVAKRLLNRIADREKIVLQSDNENYTTYEEHVNNIIAVYKAEARITFNLSNQFKFIDIINRIERLEHAVKSIKK